MKNPGSKKRFWARPFLCEPEICEYMLALYKERAVPEGLQHIHITVSDDALRLEEPGKNGSML